MEFRCNYMMCYIQAYKDFFFTKKVMEEVDLCRLCVHTCELHAHLGDEHLIVIEQMRVV